MSIQTLYKTDKGNDFIAKLNTNFADIGNLAFSDNDCRARFIQEMNKKAQLLGMSNTTFYDPAGNQPATLYLPNYQQQYPQMFLSENANTMSAIDALKMLLFASGIRQINSAWSLATYTLNYTNGETEKTATITSSVMGKSDALATSYQILGGKTGSMLFAPLNAKTLVVVARSIATGKIFICADFSTSTTAIRDNVKSILDAADNNTAAPQYSQGAYCVGELPAITPSLYCRTDIPLIYTFNSENVSYPASVTKIMTAILLCESNLDLEKKIAVKESDRQPPTGTNFVAGDTLRLREYLQCMLMESSNTSAQVIARVVGNKLLNDDLA